MRATVKLAWAEFRRFKGGLPRLALAFLLVVPLMYGALYLWSNWDPYGRLDQVPVAVVNLDQQVEFEDRPVHAGDDLVGSLREQELFDWHFTDAEDARDGLAEGRYYLTITIPQDFSARLISGTGEDPQRALVLLHRDDANGYVIGMLTSSVQTQLESAIDASAISTYVDAVFAGLQEAREQLLTAEDGAHQLDDGLGSAVDGATTLQSGLVTAADGAADLNDGLGTAGDGASTLADGLSSAAQGSTDLLAGARTASDGAGEVADGADRAATGAADLLTGITSAHTGAGDLAAGADQVAAGNATLADTVVPYLTTLANDLPAITAAGATISTDVATITDLVADGTNSLADRTASLDAALAALAAQNPDLAGTPAFTELSAAVTAVANRSTEIDAAAASLAGTAATIAEKADGLAADTPDLQQRISGAADDLTALKTGSAQVATGLHTLTDGLDDARTGADSLSTGLATLSSGATDLDTGLTSLVDGAQSLNDGLGDLSSGAADLDEGLVTLHTGAGTLADGLADAATGSADLQDGLVQLESGAGTLAGGLTDAVQKIPVLTPDQQDRAAAVLSQPAEAQMTVDHPAEFYGRGLAPFFFGIAIWVFGIAAFLVLRPTTPRVLAGRARPTRLAFAGWLPLALMSTAGSLLLLLVSDLALGLNPVHTTAAIGLVVLAALCFSAIAHVLRVALGTVGSAITLVLLMLQLTSAGGLYPVETLPLPFRMLNPIMPMTYLVDGLRVAFTGGRTGHLWRDVAVLGGFTVVALAATCLVMARRQQFRVRDLYPPLAPA